MKRYFKSNYIIICISVVLSVVTVIGSSFVAVFLQKILDAAISLDKDLFAYEVIKSIMFFCVLLLVMYTYSLFTKKCIRKIVQSIR